MATSDDFKQELKAGNFGKALKLALSEAIELQITTWVVPINSSGLEPKTGQPGYRMRTRINIVDGDIDNEVGTQFLSNGPYTELRQFHIEQVQQGRETIQKNLQGLQKIFGLLLNVPQAETTTDPTAAPAAEQNATVPMQAYITDDPIPTAPVEPIFSPKPVTLDSPDSPDALDSQPSPEPESTSPEIFQAPPTSGLAPEALGDLTLPEDAPTTTITPQAILATSATALLGTVPAAIASSPIEAEAVVPPSSTAEAETGPLDPQALGELTLPEDPSLAAWSEETGVTEAPLSTAEAEGTWVENLSVPAVTTADILSDVPTPEEIPLETPAEVEAPFSESPDPFADTTGFALGSNAALTSPADVEAALNSLFPDSTVEESYPSATDFTTGEDSGAALPELFGDPEEAIPTPEADFSTAPVDSLPDLFGDPTAEMADPLSSDSTAAVELEASLSGLFDDQPAEAPEAGDAIANLQDVAEESPNQELEDSLPDDLFLATDEDIPNPYAADPIPSLELDESLSDLFTDEDPGSSAPVSSSPPELEDAFANLLTEPAVESGTLEAVSLDQPEVLITDSWTESSPDFGLSGTTDDSPEDFGFLQTATDEEEVEALTDLFATSSETLEEPVGDVADSSPEPEAALADLFTTPDDSSSESLEPGLTDDPEDSLTSLFEESAESSLTLDLEDSQGDRPWEDPNLLADFAPTATGTPGEVDPLDASLIDLFTESDPTAETYPPLTTPESELTLNSETTPAPLADESALESSAAPAVPSIPLSELFDDSDPDVSLLFAEAPPVDPTLSVEESLAVLFKAPEATTPANSTPEITTQEVPEIDEAALSALFADASDSTYSFTVVSETSEAVEIEFPSLLEESEPETTANPFADFLSTTDLPAEEIPPQTPSADLPSLLPPPARKKRDQNNQKSGG